MAVKIGINGFGRIATGVIRAAMSDPDVEISGINIRNADFNYLVYMLKYDSTFGRFPKPLDVYEEGIVIDGKKVPVFSEEDAANIPWSKCGAEYIIEATGVYLTTEKASVHITSGGAKKVLISAPAKDKETPTFVCGVNLEQYTPDMQVVSNASCTTNCLAPLCKVLEDNFGIEQGLMSTIHAVTSKQKVVDARNQKDWRTGRSIFGNIIPSTTGAAKAVGKVIPSLAGKMTGISYRVPVVDVSVVDLNVMLKTPTTLEEINNAVKKASETNMKGIMEYVDDEVVSGDFRGDTNTSIFDARQGIQLTDRFFKLVAYYDNEFGYSAKMLELAKHMYEVDNR
ncbi:MAG: type I glyceraldehyde-3-phosphate dehydrogenase [Firmicutes bacterium]|nr:type I glyceraldehyde-3-phosphate dehydrogenase [Bacillota bacterium]